MRKLGVIGGTFDPIHYGHLAIAEEARARLDLPEVRFIPAGQPPHKPGGVISPAADRLAMVRLAVAGNPAFTVSTVELERTGPSFTVDTLARLREQEGPDCALYFIAGGDALADLLTWREPARLLALATLVIVQRPGATVDRAALEARLPALRQRLRLLDGPRFDLSGTLLRQRVREGVSIRYQTPDTVLAYIQEHRLYHKERDSRMTEDLNEQQRPEAGAFGLIAAGYDGPALAFFRNSADRLVDFAAPRRGARVLDVATGTGIAALLAASRVGPSGHVVGVDRSPAMLDEARRKASAASLPNVEFREATAERLPFPDADFDVVLCATALFLLPDMGDAVREQRRVTKHGGTLAFQAWAETAFHPFADLFRRRLQQYGVRLPDAARPYAWQRLTRPEQYAALLRDAGCQDIELWSEQVGYYVPDAETWWGIVWNSGFRGFLAGLAPDQLDRFRVEHTAEVAAHATERGIWVDIPALLARGRVA